MFGKNWKKFGKIFDFFKLFSLNFFFTTHHSDQMSDGSQVLKFTICVQNSKDEDEDKGRYRSARAAKNRNEYHRSHTENKEVNADFVLKLPLKIPVFCFV